MGAAGGSFASGFAQTLMQGMALQNQIATQQEDLKIKRQIADANLKLHEAQTADIERKVRTAAALFQRMQPQQQQTATDENGSYQMTSQPAAPLSPQERLAFQAMAGDVSGALKSIEPHFFQPGQGLSAYTPATDQTQQIAAPQAPPINPFIEKFMAGGAQPAAGGNGEAPAGQPQGGGPLNPAGIPYEPPTFTFDAKGGITAKIGPTKYSIHESKVEYPEGSGQQQVVLTAVNPMNPADRHTIPIGKPLPADELQKLERIAESWGVPPGDARRIVAGQIAAASLKYNGPAQAIAIDELEAKTKEKLAKGLTGTATTAQTTEARAKGIPGPLQKAKDLEVQTAGEKTAAEVQARNANEPPQGAAQNKIQMLQSVERQMGLVQQNFDAKFVGKGFGNYSDKLKKEFDKQEALASKGQYAGAFAGNVRAFLGTASPEEITFRNALLDSADLLLRARSGAQINEQEYNRLKSILPQLTDEPNTFLPAMKRFQDETSAIINDTLKIGSTGAREQLRQRETAPAKAQPPKGFRRE